MSTNNHVAQGLITALGLGLALGLGVGWEPDALEGLTEIYLLSA